MTTVRLHHHQISGFVLVSVIWILAVLTIITISFGKRALLEQRAAAYALDELQASWLARGAAIQGILELEQKNRIQLALGNNSKDMSLTHGLIPLGSSDLRTTFPEDFTGPFANEECGYHVTDEERRMSINHVSKEFLDNLELFDSKTTTAILDRIKEGRRHGKPAFHVLEELLCIESIEPRLWEKTESRPGIRELFTVYGDGRVNINTAPLEVLQCLPQFDRNAAEKLVALRAGVDGVIGTPDDKTFVDLAEALFTVGFPVEKISTLSNYCKTDSQYFRISGFATRRQKKIHATSTVIFRWTGENIEILRWEESVGGA